MTPKISNPVKNPIVQSDFWNAIEYLKNKGNHIITTKIEHKAILDTCKKLESKGS